MWEGRAGRGGAQAQRLELATVLRVWCQEGMWCVQEEGILEWLRTTYIRIPNSICEQELNGSDTFSISFTEVRG